MPKQDIKVATLASRIKEIANGLSFEDLKRCERNHHIYNRLVDNVKHPKLKKIKKERYYWTIQHNTGNIRQFFEPFSSELIMDTFSEAQRSDLCDLHSVKENKNVENRVKCAKTSTPLHTKSSIVIDDDNDISPIKSLDRAKRSLNFSSPDRFTIKSKNLNSPYESVSSPEYFFTRTSSIDKCKKVRTDLNITSDEIEVPDSILNLSGEQLVINRRLPVGSRNIEKSQYTTSANYSKCTYYEGSFIITRAQWDHIFVGNKLHSRIYPYFFRSRIRTYVNNSCNIAFQKIRELKNMFKILGYCRHNHNSCKKFVIQVDKNTTEEGNRNVRIFSSSLDFCHPYKLSDQVSGVGRDMKKNKLLRITPLQHRKNEIKKLDRKFVLSTNNLLGVKSQSTIRKIRSEANNSSKRSDSDVVDLYLYRIDHPEYVKQVCDPLNVKIYSAEQIKIAKSSEDGVLYFDATGTVVRNQNNSKQVLYYCGVVTVRAIRRLCPVLEMVSCEQDTDAIYNLFSRFRTFCLESKSPISFHTVVTDFSFANMHAAIRAFHAMYFQEYLNVCYRMVTSPVNMTRKFIVIRICCAHMMKNVCQLINSEVSNKSVASLIKEIFAGAFNITSFDELVEWFKNVNYLLCSPKKNAKTLHATEELAIMTMKDKEVIAEITKSENLLQNKYEENPYINQKDEGLRKGSPFYTTFKKIHGDVSNELRIIHSSMEANPYYHPKLIETFLNRYMPFAPMFVPMIGQIRKRLSNNAVERFFGILKYSVLNSSRDLRPTTFIRKVREHVLTVHMEIELDLSEERLGIAPKKCISPVVVTVKDNLHVESWSRQPKKRHSQFTARFLQVPNVITKINKAQAEHYEGITEKDAKTASEVDDGSSISSSISSKSIATHSSRTSNLDRAEEKWGRNIKTTLHSYFDAKRLKRKLFPNLSLIPESPENVVDLTHDQNNFIITKSKENYTSDKEAEALLKLLLNNALVDSPEFYTSLDTYSYVVCSYKKSVNACKLLYSYQFNTLETDMLSANTMDLLSAMCVQKYGIKRNVIWSTERATLAIEKGKVTKAMPILNNITYMPIFAFEEKWLLLKVDLKKKTIHIFNPFGTLPQEGKEYLDKFRVFLMEYNLVQRKPIEILGWKIEIQRQATIDVSDNIGGGIVVIWYICQFLEGKNECLKVEPYNKPAFLKELRRNLLQYSDNMTDLCLICGGTEVTDEDNTRTLINWIRCSICSRWVHNICDKRQLNLNDTFSSTLTTYYCILCSDKYNVLPIIKNKCLSPCDDKDVTFTSQMENINNEAYSYKLQISDIKTLLDPYSELTDTIINRFGELLNNKSEYCHQDVLFCNQNLINYIKAIDIGKKNIQILYGGNPVYNIIGHWVCSFYDGNTINIYDSLNMKKLYESQHKYLKKLYPFDPIIKFRKVQQQCNAIDCGLFAIAFSVTLYFGKNPENMCYDIVRMRDHIFNMLKNERLEMFPEVM